MCDSLSSADAVMGFTVIPLFSMLTGMIRLVVALFGDSLLSAMLPEAQVRLRWVTCRVTEWDRSSVHSSAL